MPAKCFVCQLDRSTIKKLEFEFVNGLPVTAISKKYKVSYFSIRQHCENHLPIKVAQGAKEQLNQEGFNLMTKIDELYEWMSIIFRRNFDKKRDNMALKALGEQRHTLELLAKISYAMHQNKVLEMEQEKQKFLDTERPMERLTEKEKELYFQINRKLLGEDVTIDLSEFSNYEEVSVNEVQNKRKEMTRTKFQPDKLEPEVTATTTKDNDSDDKEMRFKPFVDSVSPKSNRSRRDFDYFMRKKNPPQYGSKIHPAFIPFGEGE